MDGKRRSLLDATRNSNFLRKSFCKMDESCTLKYEDYATVLLTERQQWKQELKEKQKESLKKINSVIIRKEDVRNLNEADEAFLSDRPDYLSMSERAKRYLETIQHYHALQEVFKNRYTTVIEKIKKDHDTFARELLREENENCGICNNNFCTKELHRVMVNSDNYCNIIDSFDSLNLQEN